MFSWKWTWIACVMLMYQHKVMSDYGNSTLPPTTTTRQHTDTLNHATPTFVGHEKIEQLLGNISRYASSAYSSLRNSYYYIYDGPQYYIANGGNDMYNLGNSLQVRSKSQSFQIVFYNKSFSDPDGNYVGASFAGHPFLLLLAVNLSSGFVEINEVSHLDADGAGFTKRFDGFVTAESFYVEYKAYQVYNAERPTVVQVFFVLTSDVIFNSWGSWNLTLRSEYSSTKFSNNTARLDGYSLKNAYFGYALLSRTGGIETTEQDVNEFITNILYQALGDILPPSSSTPHPPFSYSTSYTPPYPTEGPTGGPPTGGCSGAYRESLRRWNEMMDRYMHELEDWKRMDSCN